MTNGLEPRRRTSFTVSAAKVGQKTQQLLVPPRNTLFPTGFRQYRSSLTFNFSNQFRSPRVVLAPLVAHPTIRGPHFFCVRSDAAPRIQIDSLKRSNECPSSPQTVFHHGVKAFH